MPLARYRAAARRIPGPPDRLTTHRIDSTMHAAAGLPLGSVVLADEQTAGQGRHGHSWHSEPASGIYCSIVLDPSPVLTLALGLAAAEAIARSDRHRLRFALAQRRDAGRQKSGRHPGAAGRRRGHRGNRHQREPSARCPRSWKPPRCGCTRAGNFRARSWSVALLHSIPSFVSEDTETILRLFTHASSYAAGRRVVVDQPGGTVEGVTAGLDPAGFLIVRKDDGTDTLILAGGVRAAGS